jgi:fatty acid desaturase
MSDQLQRENMDADGEFAAVAGNSEVAALWSYLRGIDADGGVKALHRRSAFRSVVAALLDWSCIVAAVVTVLAVRDWWAWVAAIIVVGNRQRALVVLVHDASHYTFHPSRRLNDLLAQQLLCLPMFISLAHYRALHVKHHRHLGQPRLDTDYLHSDEVLTRPWLRTYLAHFLDPSSVRSAAIGMLAKMKWRERLHVALWWVTILAALALCIGGVGAFTFCAIWFAARFTVYHATISFVIISDHVGLVPGSILSFTRNHPRGPMSWIMHPHGNGWHLTHHLLPALPFYSLHSAHKVLLGWPAYARGEHCASYFFGIDSVIRSWRRQTRMSRRHKGSALQCA